MDQRKKKKTNKKREKSQELSIGNLRKTEMNCAQCQKQLFGLWKNESFQTCLECTSKKTDVLTMLKSLNRVCEVRVNSQVVENAVLMRSLSAEDREMEQNKNENDFTEKNNEKQYMRNSENRNIPLDSLGDKISQRTRRSLILKNQSGQYKDNCKSNCITKEPTQNINEDKVNSNNRVYITGNVENEKLKTVTTSRRSSLTEPVLELPNNRNKRTRQTARCTHSFVENNLTGNETSVQHRRIERKQQLPVEEKAVCQKRKKGKELGEVDGDDSRIANKMVKHQPEILHENKVFNTKDKNVNPVENRKRRQVSPSKETVYNTSPHEEYIEQKKCKRGRPRKGGSQNGNKADNKSEKKAQTEENSWKQKSIVASVEMKKLKINMEKCDVSGSKRKKRSVSQNRSPNSIHDNKTLVNDSIDASRRRTRALLKMTVDKITTETEPEKCTVLDIRLSNRFQGLEHEPEDKKEHKVIQETNESSETDLFTPRKDKWQGKAIQSKQERLVKSKEEPPIPVRTLELLRTTKGMKPVVLVEKMMTIKQKLTQQPDRNEKRDHQASSDKGSVVDHNEQVNKEVDVSSKDLCEPEQKLVTLRGLSRNEDNQNKLLKTNGNNIEKSKQKIRLIKKYHNIKLKKSSSRKKKKWNPCPIPIKGKTNKKTKHTQKLFPCEKCKKCFVNVLQQKSHELLHSGYFELKLKRIDADKIHKKTEGEIISKDIISYILTSVFTTETDSISDHANVHPSDCADALHPNVSEEMSNTIENNEYKLKHVKVMLKRIDLREAVAMNKCNEGVIVATSIVNSILNKLDDKPREVCIHTHGETAHTVSDDYNKTMEVESSELEESCNQECIGSSEMQTVALVHIDQQTDNQSQKINYSENCNTICDSSEVVSNYESEQDDEGKSSDMLKSEDVDNVNKDADIHEIKSSEEQFHNRKVHYNDTNEQETDQTVDSHLLTRMDEFSVENACSVSSSTSDIISNEGSKILTSVESTEFLEKMVSKGSEIDNIELRICKMHNVDEDEYKVNNEVQEITMNASVLVRCNEDEKSCDLDTTTTEYSDIVPNTRSEYNEKMLCETEEDDTELDKKEATNGKNTEFQNTKEVLKSANSSVENSTVEKTDSEKLLEILSGGDDNDNDCDLGDTAGDDDNDNDCDLGDTAGDDDNDNDNDCDLGDTAGDDDNDYDCDFGDTAGDDDNDNDYDCDLGDTDESNTHMNDNQQTDDETGTVETNKSLSICSSSDNNKSENIPIESREQVIDNNINKIFSDSEENLVNALSKNLDECVNESDKITWKNSKFVLPIQDQSSESKEDACEFTSSKDSSEISKGISFIVADGSSGTMSNQMPQSENRADEITDNNHITTQNSNFKGLRFERENEKSEVAVVSEEVLCNQEVENIYKNNTHNIENNSKMVSDNEIVNNIGLTNISANHKSGSENHNPVSKEETESIFGIHPSDKQHVLDFNETSDKRDVLVSENTDTAQEEDSLEIKHFDMSQDKNETDFSNTEKGELINMEDPSSEFDDDLESKSTTGVKEDSSRDSTSSDSCKNQIFTTVPDSKESTLHYDSNNFVQMKSIESNDCEEGNGNKRMNENTLENDVANESNFKSMERYLESFIKDFFVRNTERTETDVENNSQNKQEKLGMNEEIEKLIVTVAPTEDRCTTSTESHHVVTETSNINVTMPVEDKCTNNSASHYITTEKVGLYNDSLQNVTGMLFEGMCLSSDIDRKSQKVNEKESLTPNSFSITVANKDQIQLNNTSAETEGDVYRHSDKACSEMTPLTSYISDTSTTSNYRLGVSDETETITQGQFCPKTMTDIGITNNDSISNTQTQSGDSTSSTQRCLSGDTDNTQRQSSEMSSTQRQSSDPRNTQRESSSISSAQSQSSDMSNTQRHFSDKMQTGLPSSSNHITYTVQKQSCDRRESDLSGASSSHVDNVRRFSGDRYHQTESSPDGIRRHSSDRREDYSTAGSSSNAYQRPVVDNRRYYSDTHDSRQYTDTRDNRGGNLYGSNWKHQTQNRMHSYQHNPHKRNDRGSYSNWRWPGTNSYPHYRQSNNWR